MNCEKLKTIKDKLRKFTVSDWYSIFLFAVACIFIITDQEVLGTYIFAMIISFTMLLSEDLLPALEGLMTVTCFAIQCKYSFNAFIKLWPLSIPVIIMVFAHFFLYKKKLQMTSFMPGMIATSIAILLGGAGVIYWKSYFSPTSEFYMCLLGYGMVIICAYLTPSLSAEKDYHFESRFCRMHITAIFTIVAALFNEYFTRRVEFLNNMTVLQFQWRNNASSILMLAMPFAFYLATKKYYWTFVGILSYIAIVFTGSRGGLVFGACELVLCLLIILVIDKKHRIHNSIILLSGLGVVIFMSSYFISVLSGTIHRIFDFAQNAIRLELIQRGFEDFKTNPVFGRGLAYMGNRDVHQSAKYTLCWYHNSVIQVFASFGLVGVAAYLYLNILRIRTFIKNMSFFSIILFTSFIGIEMMSLVNPGVFAPFPYLFFVTVYFIAMEKCNKEGKESIVKLYRGN